MKAIIKKMLVFVFLVGSMSASSQNKDLIAGKWLNASGDAHILIYQNSGKFHGRLVWMKNPDDENGGPRLDKNNPDAGLSRRPLMGTLILKDFIYQDGVWEGGSIYDPKTGKTYSCLISMDNRDKINVRGFVGISVLGRTESWTRVR